MSWYALFVESGQEDIVQQSLRSQFSHCIHKAVVPKRMLPEKRNGVFYDVTKKIFPGYVFIETRMNPRIFYELQRLPKFYKLVRNASYLIQRANKVTHNKEFLHEIDSENDQYDDLFTYIEDAEMNPIIQLLRKDDTIHYSQVSFQGNFLSVKSGPLVGLENSIRRIDKRKRRAKIGLNIMGVEKTIDVGIEIMNSD
ncbi:antiterminator LoaP [Paenibacillus sp. IHBB 10380]|uniref:antiterminator LoaP n=1 Tax=Paenibacillus sp. IHBB 10380 TaxID=1566358 RepID=UPI0005CFEB12|nr:antiterminator LoaP [Paenibacillus sp. IHBB 10380]AJS58364.1 hypothetical protein UB51_07470 [Paenibacillus sp. IHBB 10380]